MFVKREDYVGKKVTYKDQVYVIEDIAVVVNLGPAKGTLMFRLNGRLVPAVDCFEYHE